MLVLKLTVAIMNTADEIVGSVFILLNRIKNSLFEVFPVKLCFFASHFMWTTLYFVKSRMYAILNRRRRGTSRKLNGGLMQ